MSESVLPMFFSRSFIVSGLTFRSLIHFLNKIERKIKLKKPKQRRNEARIISIIIKSEWCDYGFIKIFFIFIYDGSFLQWKFSKFKKKLEASMALHSQLSIIIKLMEVSWYAALLLAMLHNWSEISHFIILLHLSQVHKLLSVQYSWPICPEKSD